LLLVTRLLHILLTSTTSLIDSTEDGFLRRRHLHRYNPTKGFSLLSCLALYSAFIFDFRSVTAIQSNTTTSKLCIYTSVVYSIHNNIESRKYILCFYFLGTWVTQRLEVLCYIGWKEIRGTMPSLYI
jgi:hypothetical protein